MNPKQPQNKKQIRFLDHPILWLIIIAVSMIFWVIPIFTMLGIAFLILYCRELVSYLKKVKSIDEYEKQAEQKIIAENASMQRRFAEQKQKLLTEQETINLQISEQRKKLVLEREEMERRFSEDNFLVLREKIEKAEKKIVNDTKKIEKLSYIYNAIISYVKKFQISEPTDDERVYIEKLIEEIEIENLMEPTAEIKLHSFDIKDLRKQFRDINSTIENTFNDYEKRYTTKANISIYRLMVVALRSELQNVLYVMKFGKLEDAENAISEICEKYIKITAEGNQSIAITITRFVVEMEYLFISAARVEYEYYLRKERMKEEQRALREQMRQEAEERKALEQQQKQIEKEESKYTAEMEKLRSQMESANEKKQSQLANRIAELEAQLATMSEKKEEIAKLQHGKAGYIYVISNLGSFGDHVFKIGMTRRLNPQERIDELGSASVPFSFDVHSFIFSQDAPALETAIHHRLNDRRVNKVNLRKEFFDIPVDDLEALVHEIEPSAEFNRTMAAEQYRQSLSISNIFDDFESFDDTEE